jgi:hypothetical protein
MAGTTYMRNLTRFLALAALVGMTASCGDVVRNGKSPSYLVIDSLAGIRGASTIGTPASTLISDVITNVTSPAPCTQTAPCPTIFGDSGQAIMHIALKDPGTATTPSTPSQVNSITIDRYRVDYIRADGRNTPGVDVPYGFDGAVTVTVANTTTTFGFALVRVVAKEEAPLVQLKNSASFITGIARVTFYGHDQAGNEVTATGSIQIDFGNFGDPA